MFHQDTESNSIGKPKVKWEKHKDKSLNKFEIKQKNSVCTGLQYFNYFRDCDVTSINKKKQLYWTVLTFEFNDYLIIQPLDQFWNDQYISVF